MKFILYCIPLLLINAIAFGQDFSDLDQSPMDVSIIRNGDNSPMARIIYSRPHKKGRKIFGGLVPYGQVWRTGANEATEITLYNDMMVHHHYICAGTYSLYTIPGPDQWTVILNEAANAWGAFDYDSKKDVARFTTQSQPAAATIETFSIALQPIREGAILLIGWDDVYIEVPMKNITE